MPRGDTACGPLRCASHAYAKLARVAVPADGLADGDPSPLVHGDRGRWLVVGGSGRYTARAAVSAVGRKGASGEVHAVHTDERPLAEKLARMQARLRELGSVAVAFSAGADSMFVLKVALDTLGPANVVAVTGRSDSLDAAEFADACRLADAVGAEHVIIDTEEFANPHYTSNPTDRCYFCKTTLYEQMERFIAERGIAWIVNGTNADDLGDWRPGLQAANERRVASPAAEAGMTKQDIRELSRQLGLPTYDKPASPCLSSRIPYGQKVTPQKLRMVEAGERFLKETLGVRECRVRHYGTFARLELPLEIVEALNDSAEAERIESFFRELGFERVEVDPRGFRSGSLNDVIVMGRRQGAKRSDGA
jgi:uncharacterized protein